MEFCNSLHMSNTTPAYNTNENVKVVINARIDTREMCDMVTTEAIKMVDTGCAMPEEFEDIFDIQIITRPSGSKYAWVNMA